MKSKNNPYIQQRMHFIRFMLHAFGFVKRAHLVQFFGVSMPQATNDLADYCRDHPDDIRYSRKQKNYVVTEDFKFGSSMGPNFRTVRTCGDCFFLAKGIPHCSQHDIRVGSHSVCDDHITAAERANKLLEVI